ncbi:hypothetical protein [Cupriavidus campinensis]|nr:hypothetical protein [Cupriavidus campinensis]
MPVLELQRLRKKANQMGHWAATRWLRNEGFSFDTAHYILFGRTPRKA